MSDDSCDDRGPNPADLRRENENLRREVRDLRRALEAAREGSQRYQSLADSAPDAIFGIDADARVTAWNPSASRIFGYEERDAIGEVLCSLIVPEPQRKALGGAMQAFLAGADNLPPGNTVEFSALRSDGSEFLAQLTVSRVNGGVGWRATGIVRDVTEQRRMSLELQRIDKLESIGVLAGGIAHDFNNYLTAISATLALARRRPDPERLVDAEKATEQAAGLTRQLLTFAQGGAPLLRSASIAGLLSHSAEFVLRGSNVRCDLQMPDDIWDVAVDASQMSQVFHNLFINADQAMPDGGVITVQADNVRVRAGEVGPLVEGPYVSILVADEGTGIAHEHLPKVFDPFFTTKDRGSGLGLATTYSIIQAHGGYVTVESAPGAGSTFRVFLPASDEAPPAEVVRGTRPGAEKLLLMDDDERIRTGVGDLLRDMGYQVATACEGSDAVSLYRAARDSGQPFALVILDLTVPGGMGGRDTMAELRRIDPGARAVVASGYSSDPVLADFRAHGFEGALTKPFTVGELDALLRTVLDRA